MSGLFSDRNLIKFKDIILLVMALAGLFVGINKYYRLPFQVEELDLKEEQRAAKYIPIIERHETQLAIVTTQYQEIIRRLERIEKQRN